jgi:hypothetical protein
MDIFAILGLIKQDLEKIQRHDIALPNKGSFDYGAKHPNLGTADIGNRWATPREIANSTLAKIKNWEKEQVGRGQ